ncbi:complexin isoform X2 [Centruroides vittatus]|uniref:complexin isoform X2 n=1 Tax=Centruroides vittatus TaxID=120091 RepID=UPI00350F1BAD
MAAFVAKQMLGSKMNAVKGSVGGENEMTEEEKQAAEEAEKERLDALREIEERRKEKHRKLEEEREQMRQQIRDKYNIKKKEEIEAENALPEPEGGLNRRKKTPEELAAEAELEDQDDFTKLKNSLETQVNELKSTIEGKCALQ